MKIAARISSIKSSAFTPVEKGRLVARSRPTARLWKRVTRALQMAVLSVCFGHLSAGAALASEPERGGTAPHLFLRLGDPASFEVRAPGPDRTTDEVRGTPLTLTMSNAAEGYKLITDSPLPSAWVGDYTLSVTTTDETGATATREFTITYAPGEVDVVTASDGELWIPAVAHSFKNSVQQHPITTSPWLLPDGSMLAGAHEVRVSLHRDSTVPLLVGGVWVNPGDVGVPVGIYDFTTAKGILEMPLAAADAGIEGQARLLITTTAPNSPAVDLTVKTWMPRARLVSDTWEAQQAFDEVRIEVQPEIGNRCELTVSRRVAKDSDVLVQPKCLIEWDPKPEDLEPVTGATPLIAGRMWTNGTYTVGYQLSLVDPDDVKVPVTQGTQTLTINPIEGLLSYTPLRDSDEAYRLVQPIEVMMQQDGGPACDTYAAIDGSENRSSRSIVRCELAWTMLPDALSQDNYWIRPRLTGTLSDTGTQTVEWTVSVVTPLGARVPAGQGSFAFEVSDPPEPTIREEVEEEIRPGLYPVSREGGYVGDVIVTAANAKTHVTVDRDGELVEDNEYEAYPWGKDRDLRRRINAVESDLWKQTPWTVEAVYPEMPWLKGERTFHTLAVPSPNIRPLIEVADTEVLDTEDLPLRVSIRNIYDQAAGYIPDEMGEWRVRVVKYVDVRTIEPLTEFAELDGNGDAIFTLPAGTLATGSLRLTAEAQLISPVPEYSRTELAMRPINVTVLNGRAIGAELAGRRIVGEAPLTSIISVELDNRMERAALQGVVWEVSEDGGATWTEVPSQRNNFLRMTRTFQKGEYLVRATLTNKFSGATFVTEAIEIIAFDVPQGQMTGPEFIFVGGRGHYKLELSHNGMDLTQDMVTVEWSTDGGETFTPGGLTLDLAMDEPARFVLVGRVKMADAPADAREAWREIKRRVNFVEVRPPMVRIVGPSRVEFPKSGEYRGVMGLPYRNMDVELKGWWELPDGTRVDGPLLTYTPKAEDVETEIVVLTFHAEIVGFEGATNQTQKRVRVWEYVWPEFSLETQRTSQYAPANLTLRLRQLGRPMELDRPSYSWVLPPNGELKEDRNPTVRVLHTPEAGDYPVSVSITDARGHSGTAQTVAKMLPAPSYEMSLRVTGSNKFNRAPLDIVVRPEISGGHPRDRITSMTFILDGHPMQASGSTGRATLSEGHHTIEVRGETEMGWQFGAVHEITVVPNQRPSCSVEVREWANGWLYYASCADPDGRVVQYRWSIDGEPESLNSSRISVSRFGRTEPPIVTLVAVDDVGAESDVVTPVVEVPDEPSSDGDPESES